MTIAHSFHRMNFNKSNARTARHRADANARKNKRMANCSSTCDVTVFLISIDHFYSIIHAFKPSSPSVLVNLPSKPLNIITSIVSSIYNTINYLLWIRALNDHAPPP